MVRVFALLVWLTIGSMASAAPDDDPVATALARSGGNKSELVRALQEVPDHQAPGMQFLIANMPDRDLRSLTADFLLRNVQLAYQTREAVAWKIPDDVFFNNVLPYANINEQRDDYRRDFRDRFSPLVQTATSPSEAAAILNNQIFKQLNVKYSRQRRRADQGPFESMETGLASCTGLSILLIDACRSVGVPARFVGTPLWSDRSGNHSWVEVWDDGWHFTGAAEPTGLDLDKAWFTNRSSVAQREVPEHAIYAVSFKRTPLHFPLVWDPSIQYVHAVNVTDRYANHGETLPPDHIRAMFQALGNEGHRCCLPLIIRDESGKVLFEGKTKDERFDGNDHTSIALPINQSFQVRVGEQVETIRTGKSNTDSQLFSFETDTSPND